MSKNIVICCDGTGNQFDAANTNVVKLFAALDLSDPSRQIGFYDPGVGTGNPRDAATRTRRWIDRIAGLAFGAGLYRNLADAYAFLMRHYKEGDRLFVFGFSRGAYTARALTGFLHFAGLLRPGNENLIPYAMELYRQRLPANPSKRNARFKLAREFKSTFSRSCPTHFIGVWDTVKTVGLWDALKIATGLGTALPFTFTMPRTAFGRHALAIDERRSRFRPNLWGRADDPDMQQVWFRGVHADVGGGYPRHGLSDIALNWMLVGAEAKGLLLHDHAYGDLAPDPETRPHGNLLPCWWLLGWYRRHVRGPGEWVANRRRWQSAPAHVHESAAGHPMTPDDAIVVGDAWETYDPGDRS